MGGLGLRTRILRARATIVIRFARRIGPVRQLPLINRLNFAYRTSTILDRLTRNRQRLENAGRADPCA